ncbi:T surface-antigen of pili [Oribacterium sp. KHPX15]|uniref:DUF7601 domain-containing protein n=1 Tax=Oribacterium sp. KHPX15 TaxID=1855342 RepID=UPI00089CCADD|nr:FctA domain-containing protein [Oribacterium sp. KHPX15]SEA73139.1 T surface-antigen of pili [Oribacterium sp. KHPX15]
MRKNINKLATLVMTGALATSMSFGAFAFNFTIPKKVTVDMGNTTKAPQTTFALTVSGVEAATDSQGNEITPANVKKNITDIGATTPTEYSVTPGTSTQAGQISLQGAAFGDNSVLKDIKDDNNKTIGQYYEGSFSATIADSIFKAPGVYSFTVKETNSGYTGIKYDGATYTMYVFVIQDNGTNKVDGVILADESGKKIADITNDFGADSDNNSTHNITITKDVDGNAGDTQKEFTFNISVAPKANSDTTKVPTSQKFTLTDAAGTAHTISADNASVGYSIKEGQEIKINGLTADYDVYVTEVQANADGYTTTYTANGVNDISGLTDNKLTSASDTIKFEVTTDNATLQIKNYRQNVTPTGVAMDIAPYALMVALAGGAAATFLRKKESFED